MNIFISPPNKKDFQPITLFDKIKCRDEAIMLELYNKHSPALFGILRRILPNARIAEEVLVKVFKKVCFEIEKHNDKKETFFTWLYTITINEAIEALKTCPYHTFKRNTKLNRSSARITKTVKLEVIESALINLSYYRHFTCNQISEILQLPLVLVKKKIKSGYCKLYPCL